MSEFDNNIEIYKVSIILTTTVHVTPNTAFQVNKQDRINTYLKSIRSWLRNTNLNIIVIENSGYEFTELINELNLYKHRFEVITFTESQSNYKEYQMHLQSKGGLEINSIHYAYNISNFLKKSSFIIKITGRFFINNFENFINSKDLSKFNCLKQYYNNRCEIVGTSLKNFHTIFDKNLFVKNGKYDYHVENVYDYRFSLFRNVLVCPIFIIEETQRGGLNEKYNKL
jgi:hypothetical protein